MVEKATGKYGADRLLYMLFGVWWIVNLIQAAFTGLAHDEAYYVMFSQNMAWGYFDHPPMTPLFIWLSQWMGGDLGVRFLFTVIQPLYLWVLWRIVRPEDATTKDAALFFMLCLSMPILQLYGFIAVPDGPLMLFSALFLLCYKRFVDKNSLGSAIWLGVTVAALAYSKYHGALVVLLTLASNPKVLARPKLYAGGVVALVLILPHLVWQYENDWVSFSYHLSERNRLFRWSYVTEYLLNVLVIFNPLLFPLFVKAWWKGRTIFRGECRRPDSTVGTGEACAVYNSHHGYDGEVFNVAEVPTCKDDLRGGQRAVMRALWVLSAGFVIFFFFSTLRGYVQPQWVIPVAFGVIAILFLYVRVRDRLRKYVVTVGYISLVLFLLARIVLIFNPAGVKAEIFDNEESFAQISEAAAGRPVIFSGEYTGAAKYNYYTGGWAYGQPSVYRRTSQYELMDDDTRMASRDVLVQTFDGFGDTLRLANGKLFSYVIVPDFKPLRHIEIEDNELPEEVLRDEMLPVRLEIENPYPFTVIIDGDSIVVKMVWKLGAATFDFVLDDVRAEIAPGGEQEIETVFTVPQSLENGDYRVGYTVQRRHCTSWFNSERQDVKVR